MQTLANPKPESRSPIIIYDGECVVCSRLIRSVVEHDDGRYRVISGSDPRVKEQYPELHTERTIYLLESEGRVLEESDAILEIWKNLGEYRAGWRRVYQYLPRGLRDGLYRIVARVRRYLGRESACTLPSEVLRERML